MTGHTRVGPQHVGRRARRLLDLIRGVISAFLASAMVALLPVANLVAHQRTRARRRVVAGWYTAGHAPSALSRGSGAASSSGGSRPRASVATKREPLFSTVRVEPEFSPRGYASTFAALQMTPSAKLLDLVPARMLCADVFERLAGGWTASADTVPRLGILLSFERWVMLRETALAALQPLAARGIRVEVFYDEQASRYLDAWFTHGQLVHAVSAVVTRLVASWQPSASWPIVIDTLTRLVRAYSDAAELPTLLTEVAGLALSCGGADEAATLAREALYYLPEVSSTTRSKALRELGVALMGQGQTAAGLALLDQAIAMAATAKAPAIGASALCQSGLYALKHGDYPSAERRFRGAIDLLSPSARHSHLAQAHHNLAIALMHQGHAEAEHHARTALAMRSDPQSHLAEADRLLLSKLRERRADIHETGRSARLAHPPTLPSTTDDRSSDQV